MTRILVGMAAFSVAVSCGPNVAPKALVLYYSQTSNTAAVASEIASLMGADSEEIVSLQPYDGDFHATIQRCLKEREDGVMPEIKDLSLDIAAYDVIFLGYPVWFGTCAPPVLSLLKDVSFAGKKIVPFCTFGSGGLDSSVRDIVAAQPEAEVLEGYGVRAARLSEMPYEVDQFLKRSGFLAGEYVVLEDFPEPHPVSAEEAAILDAAISTYPMMQGSTATSVSSRAIPDGVEYLFTAVPQPRENDPKMPPAAPMKVYVSVIGDSAPVFTQVVR